ncbi:MAG: TonB-dependent receptor [Pseudomonadales bacterium]
MRAKLHAACRRCRPVFLSLACMMLGVSPQLQAEQSGLVVEEIVVTASKREEALSDVPQTVRALDSTFLEDSGVSNVSQISEYIPALQITYNVNPFTTNVRLRSLGTGGNEPSLEPSVGVFLDGVYQSRSGLGLADLVDVERIEVLYGPQGTLYGRNTNAGVLNVVTRRPTESFEAFVEGQIGNYDDLNLSGSVSGPISDDVRYRLAGRFHQRDGWMDNNLLGTDLQNIDDWVVRGQLEWDVTDTFGARLIYSHVERDQDCCAPDVVHDVLASGVPWGSVQDIANGTGALGALLPTLAGVVDDVEPMPVGILSEGDDRDVTYDIQAFFEQDSDSVALLLDWDIGEYTLHSITSYDTYDWSTTQDCERASGWICRVDDYHEGDTVTQELRLESPVGGFIDWQAGLYYYWNDLKRGLGRPFAILGDTATAWAGVAFLNHPVLGLGGPLAMGDEAVYAGLVQAQVSAGDYYGRDHQWKTEAWSAFGQMVMNFSERLNLTVGLRYNDEHKEADLYTDFGNLYDPASVGGTVIRLFAAPQDDHYELDEDNWSGMASLKAYVSEDVMMYVTAANGYKSGGFNGAPGSGLNSDVAYDPEESILVEVGAKTTLWGGRAQANVSVYQTQLKDWQAISFDGNSGSFLVNNAGEKEVRGVDLDVTALLSENLMLTAATSYLDAEFKEFEEAQCEVGDPRQIPGARPGLCDFTGETPWESPEWRHSLILTYSRATPFGEFYVRPEYSYTDWTSVSSKLGPFSDERHEIYNLRVGLRGNSWEAIVWGNNLKNDTIKAIASDAPTLGRSRTYFLGEPRTYGLTVRYSM